jgi:hypothetical protein
MIDVELDVELADITERLLAQALEFEVGIALQGRGQPSWLVSAGVEGG